MCKKPRESDLNRVSMEPMKVHLVETTSRNQVSPEGSARVVWGISSPAHPVIGELLRPLDSRIQFRHDIVLAPVNSVVSGPRIAFPAME